MNLLRRSHYLALNIALLALTTLSGAFAQAPPKEQLIDDIEKQVQVLKQAVDELRRASQTNRVTQPTAEVPSPSGAAATGRRTNTNDPVARIRDEGMNRSQVMKTLSYLTDVIGPRLTGSPNLKRANEWTRDTLGSWGLSNAHLEAWGPFGRGWSLKRFSAQIIEPYAIPLIGAPKAWTPGFDQPITGEVIYLDARAEPELDKYKGRLKGAIVLASPPREVRARFESLAIRMAETNLLRLANASDPSAGAARFGLANPGSTNAPAIAGGARSGARAGRRGAGAAGPGDNAAATTNAAPTTAGPGRRGGGAAGGQFNFQGRVLSFLLNEGAALVVNPSTQGDGGTFFISAASAPGAGGPGGGRGGNASTNAARPSVYATNAPAIPAQIMLAAEDYNRLVRMIQQGEKLKMAVDLQVQFHNDDVMAYNTIAEIPGTDLKDEIVMIGAHMDSWHSGTGATDNGAGCAASMEAVRILQALKLQPRRTIRIGLWTGEEQGLLGSKAYVSRHFGYYTNITSADNASTSGGDTSGSSSQPAPAAGRSTRKLMREPAYEKFSSYFNLDNGTGKIRGVYMQGNEAVRPLFRSWLEPFYDLGAETLTLSNTGGTDHLSFDAIGLPGFQFIQDPIEYNSRTHHSNADVFDRIQADDMKQASTIMAAFLYHAATMDEKLPRKPAN
jgi:carboxypeptidase Q